MGFNLRQKKRLAAQRHQANGGFKTLENELMHQCSKMGIVKYIPPSLYESTTAETAKRRKKMRDKLIPFMTPEERRPYAKRMQNNPQYKQTEHDYKHRCHKSSRTCYGVSYEPPLDTELYAATRGRRQRMQRKLIKYYQFKVMMNMSNKPDFLARVAMSFFKESRFVDCPLGPQMCPCHGVQQRHVCFTWRLDRDELLKLKERWRRCTCCNNVYDPLDVKTMDCLLQACVKRATAIEGGLSFLSALWKGEDIEGGYEHAYPIDLKTLYVRIKMSLMPKIDETVYFYNPDSLGEKNKNPAKQGGGSEEIPDIFAGIVQDMLNTVDKFILSEHGWVAPQPRGRTHLECIKHLTDLIQDHSPVRTNYLSLGDYGVPQPDEEEIALVNMANYNGDVLDG